MVYDRHSSRITYRYESVGVRNLEVLETLSEQPTEFHIAAQPS